MNERVRFAGYDPRLVDELTLVEASFFSRAANATVFSAVVVACGAFYGTLMTVGSVVVAVLLFAAAFLVVVNLFRLLHAGSGFPLHFDVNRLDTWWPAVFSVFVLLALGGMLVQPLVLLGMKPVLDAEIARASHDVADGLIRRGHLAWTHPRAAFALTTLLAILVAAPGWLRFIHVRSVRAYERARWTQHRELVDDDTVQFNERVVTELSGYSTFQKAFLTTHADPPYNTKPLLFGRDLSGAEKRGANFKRPWVPHTPEERVVLDDTPDDVVDAPVAPAPEPAVEKPPPPPSRGLIENVERALPTEDASLDWSAPLVDDGNPPPHTFFDLGRATGQHLRAHSDDVAPFIAAFTGRSESEVKTFLRVAPDDMPVHQLFSEWKRLSTILMKPAGFASAHGFERVVSIIVGLPVDDVKARMAAAPKEQRLTGVFAHELAKRVLKKK